MPKGVYKRVKKSSVRAKAARKSVRAVDRPTRRQLIAARAVPEEKISIREEVIKLRFQVNMLQTENSRLKDKLIEQLLDG
jgi:hypothetical protein